MDEYYLVFEMIHSLMPNPETCNQKGQIDVRHVIASNVGIPCAAFSSGLAG